MFSKNIFVYIFFAEYNFAFLQIFLACVFFQINSFDIS